MTPEQQASLIAASPLAWISLNNFVNENQKRLEFSSHRFLIDIYADNHPDICCIKSAQVGFSVYAILKSFHELIYERRNVLYALPTRNVVQDFVVPKVNPLITSNPKIAAHMGSDSVSLKKVGDRFIFFKGGSEREAISVSTDTLVIDEFDKMPDPGVVTMFDSRLNATEFPRRRRFSNPTAVNFGVDSLWRDSNQFHWMVTCHHCRFTWYIDFDYDGKCHFVDRQDRIYRCGSCKRELSTEDRIRGQWVAKYQDRTDRHGYWISQMMAPWVTAGRIMDQFEGSGAMTTEVFYSMVLGKAYTPSDMLVSRENILRACVPSHIPRVGVAMGVDQKASEMEWVAGTARGIFAYGRAKSWEEIEQLMLQWDATVVCDGRPYPTGPRMLSQKYRKFHVALGKPINTMDVLDWGKDGTVYYDRVKLLDIVAHEIIEAKLLFRMRPYELEDYIRDWQNIYRTTVEEPDGRVKSDWLKKDNKEADYPFATAYYRIALSTILGGSGGQLIEPPSSLAAPVTDTEVEGGQFLTTITQAVHETLNEFD